MELTELEIIRKYGTRCGRCNRNTSLPYQYEFTCFSCGYNVNKSIHELSKIRGKKVNFIHRLKYAEQKIFCICVDLNKTYEDNVYDKIKEIYPQ